MKFEIKYFDGMPTIYDAENKRQIARFTTGSASENVNYADKLERLFNEVDIKHMNRSLLSCTMCESFIDNDCTQILQCVEYRWFKVKLKHDTTRAS
jgi:hypothetical protein